jgi:hypothetical protein
MRESTVVTAMRDLLEQTRWTDDEVACRLAQARSVAYWEGLNPALSVDRNRAEGVHEARDLSSQQQSAVVSQIDAEGYFEIESLLPETTLGVMRDSVEVLLRNGWPPVFSFVYDEFWQITRVRSLVRVLSAVLGPDYRQIPHVWTFHIAPRPGSAGWSPHVDGSGTSNLVDGRLAVWIPLSDATLDNGCMYVIPRGRIPDSLEGRFPKTESFISSEVKTLLQASRALPARVGSVLGWDFKLIHWGSRWGRGHEARVSIALEFIAAAAELHASERPTFDAQSTLPTITERLHVIARAVRDYARFEPLMIRYARFVRQLLED